MANTEFAVLGCIGFWVPDAHHPSIPHIPGGGGHTHLDEQSWPLTTLALGGWRGACGGQTPLAAHHWGHTSPQARVRWVGGR